MGFEYQLQFPVGKMFIGIGIDGAMQCDPLLDLQRQIELLFSLYEITDHIAGKYAAIVE
jgi:hypothetical protein